MQRGGLAIFLLSCLFVASASQPVEVFVVTHSHDDVGWLMPWEQYYVTEVRSILNTVVQALDKNPARKYTQVEVAFLQRWWQEATPTQKDLVKKFYANGQLEFNVGGMTMNDESTPTYYEEVNQMTDGAKWLFDTLGARPASVWHIDPFGHSASTASLWSQIGFPAWALNRIPYTVKDEMKRGKGLEFVWRGSKTLGKLTEIWCHVMDSHYSTPSEIDFSGNWNVATVAENTVKALHQRSTWYAHSKLMIPFGDDFTHQDATLDYDNMDKLMAYVNSHPEYNMTMRYAFLSDYVTAVNKLNLTWSVFEGDFFPYNDGPNAYWSGYYASRPAYKQYLRTSDAKLANAEILLALTRASSPAANMTKYESKIQVLRDATAIGTHHDAVSGTETTSTLDDYNDELNKGNALTEEAVAEMSAQLLNVKPVTKDDVARYVSVSNPLGWSRSQVVSVYTNSSGATVSIGNQTVISQVNPLPSYTALPHKYRLYFLAKLPALSTAIYTIVDNQTPATSPADSVDMNNGHIELKFNSDSGKLDSIYNEAENKKARVNMDFYEYFSATSYMGQTSGAYIFRPVTNTFASYSSYGDKPTSFVTIPVITNSDEIPFVFSMANPTRAGVSVSSTPRGVSTKSVTSTLMRMDEQNMSDGTGHVDFAVWNDFPLKKEFPRVIYAMGRVNISAQNPTFTVSFDSATKSFGNFVTPPVVILSPCTVDDVSISLVGNVVNVDEKSFSVRISAAPENSWKSGTGAYLNWFAVQSGDYNASGDKFFRALRQQIPAGSYNTSTTSFYFEYNGPYAQDPVILMTSSSLTADFNLNVYQKSSEGFYATIRRTDQKEQKWDEISVNILIFPRLALSENIVEKVKNTKFDGPLVQEVQQYHSAGYGQTFVQYKIPGLFGQFTEVVNEVGPLRAQGRELVVRLDTSLVTGASVFTDDNGLEIIQRNFTKNTAELQAGNFHPMVQRVFLRDRREDLQLNILSETTHGAAALAEGQVEVMVHRRCMEDDGRGVGEPLDDVTPIRPSFWVTLSGGEKGNLFSRQLSLFQQFPPIVTLVPGTSVAQSFVPPGFNQLPPNVHVMTLRVFGDSYLLRLQHIFAAGEHKVLSKPVKINMRTVLGDLFTNAKITEYNLNANTPVSELKKMTWNTEDDAMLVRGKALANDVLILQAMEIRTFIYKL